MITRTKVLLRVYCQGPEGRALERERVTDVFGSNRASFASTARKQTSDTAAHPSASSRGILKCTSPASGVTVAFLDGR